eukprot:4581392-Prymnesium_polylepis.1
MSCCGPGTDGNGCPKPLEQCPFGKRPDKICRACYGRVNQRKVITARVAAVSEAGRRLSPQVEQTARASLEPWQDLTAPIKSIIK